MKQVISIANKVIKVTRDHIRKCIKSRIIIGTESRHVAVRTRVRPARFIIIALES